MNQTPLNIEDAVKERYSAASEHQEQALCCPVNYENKYLEVLPQELIDRDYGCGDPSKYVQAGETVLDLGSGGGKICYITSQIVGKSGQVIGVDMNDDMLKLAHQFKNEITQRIGYDNVKFCKGRIQDLATNLNEVEELIAETPITSASGWLELNQKIREQNRSQPMIESNSIDVVLSNCVLNLVDPEDRLKMIQEIHRVLKAGGRAVISDIVSDEPVPQHLKDDPELWSGCISGAFLENELQQAVEDNGFYGVEILARQQEPWVTVEGIEFRSMTVRAYKFSEGPCMDYGHAVVYNGPWKAVVDDEDHLITRGDRIAVCQKNFQRYTSGPYADSITPIPPAQERSDDEAVPFDCKQGEIRDPQETKLGYDATGENPAEPRQKPNALPITGGCGGSDCC
ncbi:MAG: methyltransferase domain-containing protein [Planctomycetota bacterium]|nr:methyltransferase domain-containing protein [Planctomycetota bacterium]